MKSLYIIFFASLVLPSVSFAQTPSVLVCEHLYLQVLHITDAAQRGVPLEIAIRTMEAFVDYTKDRGSDSLFVATMLLELIPIIYRDLKTFPAIQIARNMRRACEQALRFQ